MSAQISLFKFSILVVDDNTVCLNVIASMLRRWKYEVVTVNCPLNALDVTRVRDIDLVLSDLHMPKMNGIQLQKQIEAEAKLPVIIMSSDDNEKIILESLSSGAVFFISKPVNSVDLKNLWQYVVASKRDKSMRCSEKIGSIQAAGSLDSRNVSYNDDSNFASSMNKGKRSGNKKDSKRKFHQKNLENVEEENSVAPRKKKVVWDTTLHNRFLQAISYISLEKAVPKNILEFMNIPGLTRANVASHLQKFRISLKRVAEKGFGATCKNSITLDRTFQSSYPIGHSIMFKNLQEAYMPFKNLQESSSSLSPFGFGQSCLLGSNTQANVHKPYLGNTNPIQSCCTNGFGVERSDIGTNVLFDNGDVPMGGTKSMQIPNDPYKNMSPSFFGRSRIRNPNYGAPSNNMKSTETRNVSFSNPNLDMNYFNSKNYVGIQINDDGNLIASKGQMRLNSTDGLNAGPDFKLINGAQTLGFGVEAVGDSTFSTCLAPDKSSFYGCNGNYQSPTSLSGVNFEQGSASALPSMAEQQLDLENNELNDLMSELINDNNNDASSFSKPEQFGEFTNMLVESSNFQSPHHQQQGGEGFKKSDFASKLSIPFETNPPASQPLAAIDFPSPFNSKENHLSDESSLEQLLGIEEFLNPNLEDNIANLEDHYHPILENIPNQEHGKDDFINSKFSAKHQGSDDDFQDSLSGDSLF